MTGFEYTAAIGMLQEGETEAQHAVNKRVLAEVLDRDPRLRVNVNPFLLLYGSPVERNPTRYGVDIDYWA